MSRQIFHTVEGLRDLHPKESLKKKQIEKEILSVFTSYGYEQVQTPTFEYYDIYHYEHSSEKNRHLYRFFNREGDILALRPDLTPSIARYTATFYASQKAPKRFSYLGNVFFNNENYQGKLREYTQAGVEFIGIKNVEADAESIALAVQALLATGLSEFQIDLGHVDIFKALALEAGFSEAMTEEVRELIDNKNYVALDTLLVTQKIESSLKDGLLALPTLFGGLEVLEKAKTFSKHPTLVEAVDRLKEIYALLADYGIQDYVSFDLGMVSRLDYYTGVIFKGYTYGTGDSVVDGGRYDNLLDKFGYDAPAVGFAILIDDLLNALSRQKIAIEIPKIDMLLIYKTPYRKEAIHLAEALRRQGMKVELGLNGMTPEEWIYYAKERETGGMMYIEGEDQLRLYDFSSGCEQSVRLSELLKGEH